MHSCTHACMHTHTHAHTGAGKYLCFCSIFYFNQNYMCVHVQLLSHVQLFAIPWTVAHQAPLSMGFPRQEYWSALPLPSLADLTNPWGSNSRFLAILLEILLFINTRDQRLLAPISLTYFIKNFAPKFQCNIPSISFLRKNIWKRKFWDLTYQQIFLT